MHIKAHDIKERINSATACKLTPGLHWLNVLSVSSSKRPCIILVSSYQTQLIFHYTATLIILSVNTSSGLFGFVINTATVRCSLVLYKTCVHQRLMGLYPLQYQLIALSGCTSLEVIDGYLMLMLIIMKTHWKFTITDKKVCRHEERCFSKSSS